jgi:hypothetical protein
MMGKSQTMGRRFCEATAQICGALGVSSNITYSHKTYQNKERYHLCFFIPACNCSINSSYEYHKIRFDTEIARDAFYDFYLTLGGLNRSTQCFCCEDDLNKGIAKHSTRGYFYIEITGYGLETDLDLLEREVLDNFPKVTKYNEVQKQVVSGRATNYGTMEDGDNTVKEGLLESDVLQEKPTFWQGREAEQARSRKTKTERLETHKCVFYTPCNLL